MKRLHYEVSIDAPRNKVWEVLWSEETYGKWTAPFDEGSRAISDWEEGGKVLFLSAKGYGMYSKILKKDPEEYMSFQHIGMIKDGVEQPVDDKVREWSGAEENYRLEEHHGKTRLIVDVDTSQEDEKMMDNSMEPALQLVKELAEATS